jgi:hypothetical protein
MTKAPSEHKASSFKLRPWQLTVRSNRNSDINGRAGLFLVDLERDAANDGIGRLCFREDAGKPILLIP